VTVVDFEDPLTDTTYDPLGDPSGTAMQALGIVFGLSMTIILFGLANSTVAPKIGNLLQTVGLGDEGSASLEV